MIGPKELATVVRHFRLEAGLTQRELEERFQDKMFELFGTVYSNNKRKKYKPGTYVSKIETMTTKRPGWKRVVALADALGRDRDVFLALAGIRTTSDELLRKYQEAADQDLFDKCTFILTSDNDEEDLPTDEADEDTVDLGDDDQIASVPEEAVEPTKERKMVPPRRPGEVDAAEDGSGKPWVFVCNSSLLHPELVRDLELFAKRRGLSIPAAVGELLKIAVPMFVI